MPTDALICPACSSHLKRPASLREGDVFECPMCATEFNVSSEGRAATPRRASRDEVEEEVLDDLEVIVEDDEARPGRRKRRKKRSRSGAVELGRWIGLGFMHWLPVLPPAIGFCFIYVICYIVVAVVCSLFSLIPLIGPLISVFCILSIMISLSAGMTLVCLQQVQGKRWSFGDFFSGSQWWLVLLLNVILLEILDVVLILVPSLFLTMALNALHLPPLLVQSAAAGFQLLAYLCLYPLTWMFSWQLIIDGNYGPLEAITENMRMALPNFFRLLPLAMLTLLIRLFGFMLLGIGFAAAWPLAVLIETTAYLRLTGRRVAESPSEVN